MKKKTEQLVEKELASIIEDQSKKAARNWDMLEEGTREIIRSYIKLGTIKKVCKAMNMSRYSVQTILRKHAPAREAYKIKLPDSWGDDKINDIKARAEQGQLPMEIVRAGGHPAYIVYAVLDAQTKPAPRPITPAPFWTELGQKMTEFIKSWQGCEVVEEQPRTVEIRLPSGWSIRTLFGLNRTVIFNNQNQKKASWNRFDLGEPARVYNA